MIIWPVLVKYEGDSELTFVASESQWHSDADLSLYSYEAQDMLIDAKGVIHRLNQQINNCVSPIATNRSLSLAAVIELVKAHMSQLGFCCVSKLSAATIEQVINMVGEVDD